MFRVTIWTSQGLGAAAGAAGPHPDAPITPMAPTESPPRVSTTSLRDQARPQRERTMDAICIRTARESPNFTERFPLGAGKSGPGPAPRGLALLGRDEPGLEPPHRLDHGVDQ